MYVYLSIPENVMDKQMHKPPTNPMYFTKHKYLKHVSMKS